MNSTNGTYVNISHGTASAPYDYIEEPEISKIIRYVIYAFLFLLAIGGNLAVVSVPLRNKRMRNFTYFLITNLAVSDIGAMLCLPPVLVSEYYNLTWPMGEALCKLVNPAITMFSLITTNSLVAIAVDRFMALVFPFKRRPNVKESALVISLTWLLAFGLVLPSFGARKLHGEIYEGKEYFYCQEVFPGKTVEDKNMIKKIYTVCLYLINNTIPIIIISVVYAVIIIKLKGISFSQVFKRKSSKDSDSFSKPIGLTSDELYRKQKQEREKKFMKMLLSVVVVFVLFYVPVQTFFLLITLEVKNEWQYMIILYQYLFLMMWVPNALNPIFYGSMNEQYSKAFRRLFRCKKTGTDYGTSTTRGSYSKAPMTMNSRHDDNTDTVNRVQTDQI